MKHLNFYFLKNKKIKQILINYGKKMFVGVIAAILSFIIRFTAIEWYKIEWKMTIVISVLINVNILFYIEKKIEYQEYGNLKENYIKRFTSAMFGLILTIGLWNYFLNICKLHWISTHFISGFITVFVFNMVFIYEYLIGYQKYSIKNV